ncbi:hypothetical protein LZC95_24910 [Pendulispora brunnea]|uniref:Cyclic nucleotide-binding domain-containing protein n=1 Tax=Pendulispora brunnea TaxID=2905690 RepID=A0ABZ2KRW0_9BACT
MHFVDRIDRLLFLRTVPLFGDLPQERLALLSEHMQEIFVPADTVFQREGDTIGQLRIVVEGNVQGFLQSGESWTMPMHAVLGVFEFFAGRSHQSLRTTSDSVMLEISTLALRGILEDYFDVVVHTFRGLTRILMHFLSEYWLEIPLRDLTTPPNPPPIPTNPDVVDQILILRHVALFERASVDGLAALCRTTRIVHFAAGERIWTAGDAETWGGVILAGSILTRNNTLLKRSGEITFGPLSPPGLLELLAHRPRFYDAYAEKELVILRIDLDDFYDALEDHFDMTMECLGAFASAAMNVFERLGRARLEQMRQAGAAPTISFVVDGAPISVPHASSSLFEAPPESVRSAR